MDLNIHLVPESATTPSINPASDARSPLTANPSPLFSRITPSAHAAGAAPSLEAELRSASVSAPKLVKVIRTNERLGYLDTLNLSSTTLYELLNEHFNLPFKVRAFQNARSK